MRGEALRHKPAFVLWETPMRIRQWLAAAAFGTAALASAPSFGQACAGFTDVSSTAGFCPNVEWLKNRAITLGCTSATLYCPNDVVTRASMSAFMNRLGTALTPFEVPKVAADSQGVVNLATPYVCGATGDFQIAAGGYPRRAYFNSKVNVYDPTANAALVIDSVISEDSGVTWTLVQDSDTYQTVRAGGSPPDDFSTYPFGYVDLAVNKTYRFATRVSRTAGTGNVNVYCVTRVQIMNRNSATTPFDIEYAEPAYERTGRAARTR
jgi:hypothetical protein